MTRGNRIIDVDDLGLDALRLISLPESWGVTILPGGRVSIPPKYYDLVIGHLSRADDTV